MAGKILADQIEHSTAGSVDTQFVVNGSVKAWNYATQPSATIQDSFNISSMVDVSTGIMDHVYTNNMANGLYSGAFSLTNNVYQWWFNPNTNNTNTSQVQTRSFTGSAYTDQNHKIGIFGDLA